MSKMMIPSVLIRDTQLTFARSQQVYFFRMVLIEGGCAGRSCGGALITSKHILTTYHCTMPLGESKPCDHSDGKEVYLYIFISYPMYYIVCNIVIICTNPTMWYRNLLGVKSRSGRKLQKTHWSNHQMQNVKKTTHMPI